MKEQLSDQQNEAILEALNDAIEQGPWEQSNFLKVIGKNLNEIRDVFLSQLSARSQSQFKAESNIANRIALRNGQQEVFILLYSSDGENIHSWERILANLPRQLVSRPIYTNEKDVIALLKTKENKQNEAYVGIYINQGDVLPLPPDKTATDKLGTTLLSLKDKTFNVERITHFVHMDIIYRYEGSHLIKTNASQK